MLDSALLADAGAAAAAELASDATVIDLRSALPADLRAGGASAAPQVAAACPCGCGESELVDAARDGDDAALAELMRRYSALARLKARSWFVLGADRDDVVQEAMIGLYGAIRDYEPDRGASFRGFAEVCVSRSILSAVRRGSRRKHEPLNRALPLDAPVSAGDDGVRTLAELLPAAEAADPLSQVVSGEQLRALLRHLDEVLSDLEVQVLRHHVDGKSYEEIAATLQRHVKSVDNALQRIRRKVTLHLEERVAPA